MKEREEIDCQCTCNTDDDSLDLDICLVERMKQIELEDKKTQETLDLRLAEQVQGWYNSREKKDHQQENHHATVNVLPKASTLYSKTTNDKLKLVLQVMDQLEKQQQEPFNHSNHPFPRQHQRPPPRPPTFPPRPPHPTRRRRHHHRLHHPYTRPYQYYDTGDDLDSSSFPPGDDIRQLDDSTFSDDHSRETNGQQDVSPIPAPPPSLTFSYGDPSSDSSSSSSSDGVNKDMKDVPSVHDMCLVKPTRQKGQLDDLNARINSYLEELNT